MAVEKKEQELDLKGKFLTKVQEFGCSNEKLAGNFFTAIDLAIKKAEADRAGNQNKANDPKIKWSTTDFEDVLQKSIAFSNLGIDPLAKDMVSFVFHKTKTGTYTVTFIEGVKCMEIKARKHGINCPENVKVELVYDSDEFLAIKKDLSNPEDNYVLNIKNPFNRGEVIGGFSLTEYKKTTYNKLRVMSLADILKRKPSGASVQFWGGEKDVYVNGKKTGEKEKTEGWKHDMYEKTIAKNAWSKVTLDTTELADFYSAINRNNPLQFEPENTEDLPFNPDETI